jgi:hypothetical protein
LSGLGESLTGISTLARCSTADLLLRALYATADPLLAHCRIAAGGGKRPDDLGGVPCVSDDLLASVGDDADQRLAFQASYPVHGTN